MSGLLFLNPNDLQLRVTSKGQSMCFRPDAKGMMLVMYYSKQCPYCDKLFAHFKRLPDIVQGCTFAIYNATEDLVERTANTICPITFVPDVILYFNGEPVIRYDGEHEISAIQQFLEQMYHRLQKNSFAASPASSSVPSRPPPPSFDARTPHRSGVDQQQHGAEMFADPRVQQFVQHAKQQSPEQFVQRPVQVPGQDGYQSATGPAPPGHGSQLFRAQPSSPSPPSAPSAAQPPRGHAPQESAIPAYTVGKPVCGSDGRCYLSFDSAYGSGKAQPTAT